MTGVTCTDFKDLFQKQHIRLSELEPKSLKTVPKETDEDSKSFKVRALYKVWNFKIFACVLEDLGFYKSQCNQIHSS